MPNLTQTIHVYDDGSVDVIKEDTTTTPPDLYRVRKWGDPIMVKEYGRDYNVIGSNFQVVQLYVPGTATWSAVANFVTLGRAEMDYLMALQKTFGKGPAGVDSFNQRMNWLVFDGQATRPYWNGKWKTATEFHYGTMLWGGQLIQVNGEATFTTSTPNNKIKRAIRMAKVVMFTKADFALALAGTITPKTHPHLMPQCSAVGQDNKFVPTPKEFTMFSPLWGGDWEKILPTKDFYIPFECLESA